MSKALDYQAAKVDNTFWETTIGIAGSRRYRGPRVQAMRAGLAVDTVIRSPRSGLNLDDHIGALNIYLGHVSAPDPYDVASVRN
jgi:hypothetical protein